MTRINVIPPSKLTDQHAMAEYRELPMVNASLRRTLDSKSGLVKGRIPKNYTLNKGHVTFHYDKGLYLFNRYHSLVAELRKRGYNMKPEERVIDWTVFQRAEGLWQDWVPNSVDLAVNVARVVERIQSKPRWYRYYGTSISDNFVDVNYGVGV